MSVEPGSHILPGASSCVRCDTTLPWNNRSGLCPPHYRQAWYQANKNTPQFKAKEAKRLAKVTREVARKRGRRSSWKKLGLDPDEIEASYAQHDGLCDVCGDPPTEGSWVASKDRLVMEHNHVTMKHRGWVCGSCNVLLGAAKDKIKVLESAITYLTERDG